MIGPLSPVGVTVLLITIAVLVFVVLVTGVTVHRERRMNALLAARWIRAQHRRSIAIHRAATRWATWHRGKRGAA